MYTYIFIKWDKSRPICSRGLLFCWNNREPIKAKQQVYPWCVNVSLTLYNLSLNMTIKEDSEINTQFFWNGFQGCSSQNILREKNTRKTNKTQWNEMASWDNQVFCEVLHEYFQNVHYMFSLCILYLKAHFAPDVPLLLLSNACFSAL
jgi:hypothetical protein